MSDLHDHAQGLYCDDCPDALRQNIKRVLVQHRWVSLPDPLADCTCGWVMPYSEAHQHEGHQADELAKVLGELGWSRTSVPRT
jgi:hypothetical protein